MRSRPDLKKELCIIFDNIFYKKDPDKEIKIIENEEFEHYLNDIKIIANLSQLFIIEQEYCYNKESNYEPASLFYQGWIRQFIDNIKEIDKLCMSVARYRPPGVKYTKKENKKHKEYDKNVKHQWYLNNYL